MQTPWADRLFQRLAAIYGNQKLSSTMFSDDYGEVRQTWEEQLRRFSPEVLRRAIQALVDAGGEWPPTLPQFIGIAREFNRPEQTLALPPPSATDTARAAEQLGQIADAVALPAGGDPLAWARRPKSAQAVWLMRRGAQHDPRLRELLRQHVADGGARCQTREATEAVLAAREAA